MYDDAIATRFWAKVAKGLDGECWPWTAYTRSDGYGYFKAGTPQPAHRVAYQLANGPIPDGHAIHHTCENRSCCNPAHMQPMEPGQHSFHHHGEGCSKHGTEAMHRSTGGHRYCTLCNRERVAAWKARQPSRTW